MKSLLNQQSAFSLIEVTFAAFVLISGTMVLMQSAQQSSKKFEKQISRGLSSDIRTFVSKYYDCGTLEHFNTSCGPSYEPATLWTSQAFCEESDFRPVLQSRVPGEGLLRAECSKSEGVNYFRFYWDRQRDGNWELLSPFPKVCVPTTAPPTPSGKPLGTIFLTRYGQAPNSYGARDEGTTKSFHRMEGANENCQEEAAAAGLSGTWIAMLSDSRRDLRDRITVPGPFLTISGAIIANDKADFFDGTIATQIVHYADGGASYAVGNNRTSIPVLTGSKPDGTYSGYSCMDYTRYSSSGGWDGGPNDNGPANTASIALAGYGYWLGQQDWMQGRYPRMITKHCGTAYNSFWAGNDGWGSPRLYCLKNSTSEPIWGAITPRPNPTPSTPPPVTNPHIPRCPLPGT